MAGITDKQVMATQQEWAEGVVAIGAVYSSGGDYKQTASDFLHRLYGHQEGEVLFKPTLASRVPFRHNFADTLSYFVGGNVAEDKGFALRPWQKISFDDNRKIFSGGDVALSMGHYFMQAEGQKPLTVEFSFAYITDKKGDLKIKLHHSSLPYEKVL